MSKLVDMNKRLEDKVDQLHSDLKIVTLDTQLHQAILSDVITSMKEFIQNFIPLLLTSSKLERTSLIPVAQQYFNRNVAQSQTNFIPNTGSNIGTYATSYMPTSSNTQFTK